MALIVYSCNSQPDYKFYLREIGIDLTKEYKVINYDTETAIGDDAVSFEIKVSDEDYNQISALIKQAENYKEYKSGEGPDGFTSFEDFKISGFKIDDKYFYRKESTTEPIFYEVIISPNKILSFTYAQD